MALKHYKAITASTRELVTVDYSDLHKGKPHKPLTKGLKKKGGRNNMGRITSYNKSGGHKRLYRVIDFKRDKKGVEAVVDRLEYDPNRTAFIALITYKDGEKRYIIAPQNLKAGDKIIADERADIKVGNAMPMNNMPVGTVIHNIEMKPGKGGQIVRSAGSYAQLVGKDGGFAQVKLRSGEMRLIPIECYATIGAVSNPDNQNKNLGKAGRNRWLGRKQHVRGESKNPVDHPHGGRTRGGRHPQTPWGKPTKGYKTRKNKTTDKYIVTTRHQAKKKK
jgi:large subunit ribosomal protein L2